VATLWRGDSVVPDNDLVAATADNPAANKEARASHRANGITVALILATLPTMVGSWVAGGFALRDAHSTTAELPVFIGGWLAGWAVADAAMAVDGSADSHRRNAINIYNASAPPDCGPPSPDVGVVGSQ